jgi:hypothetical protein
MKETAVEKAEELVYKMYDKMFYYRDGYNSSDVIGAAKQCALIAVQYIITANPHSNPLNTEVYSTMGWWQEVKQEIEKL